MKTANTTAKTVAVVADNTAWTFTATSASLNGHVFDAGYSVAKTGDVYVFATVQGVPVRIHVGKASPVYHECFEAAMAAKAQPKAAKQPAAEKPVEPAKPVEQPKAAEPAEQAKPAAKRKAPAKAAKQPAAEKPAEPAKPVEQPKAAEPAEQAKPATKRKAPAKAAKQPAAEKPAEPAKPVEQPKAAPATEPAKPVDVAAKGWIGTTVEGKGWRIAFDEATQRTRVIFDADPSAKQKAAIDAAGFYWSSTTKSWNKKLTCKAYRAAMALSETLNALA